jgi:hypothetical protein
LQENENPRKNKTKFFVLYPKKSSVCLAETQRPTAKPAKGKEKEKETNDNS